MAQKVLSYPFRFDPTTGGFSSVNDDSDTYKGQQIQAFLRTSKGERPIFGSFGLEDPTFYELDVSDFIDNFTDFYPSTDIKITAVQTTDVAGVTPDIVVNFI